jgi:tetratricopeptide (TPR) repeat protein
MRALNPIHTSTHQSLHLVCVIASALTIATTLGLPSGCAAQPPPVETPRPTPSGLTPMEWARAQVEAHQGPGLSEAEAEWRVTLAEALEAEAEWGAAYEHWKALRAERPNWWASQLGYGACLHMMGGDRAEVIDALTRALTLKPNHPRALTLLGQAYEDEDDLDAATQAYRNALAFGPSPDAQLGLGRVLQRRGHHLEAGALLQILIDTQGPQAATLFLLAQSQEATGALLEAEQTLKLALRLHPDPLRGKHYLHQFYTRQHRSADASTLAAEIASLKRSREVSRSPMRSLLPSKR